MKMIPKYLALDEDLEVVGMAASRDAFLSMGKFIGSKYFVYKLDSDLPDREIAGLDKLVSKVTVNEVRERISE